MRQINDRTISDSAAHPAASPDVRDTMLCLPGVLQPLLTRITGRHSLHLPPEPVRTPVHRLATAVARLVAGVGLSAVAVQWALSSGQLRSLPVAAVPLLLGWLLSVGGARALQVTIGHHLVHDSFFPRERRVWNRRLYQIISTVLVLQDYDGYFADHIQAHHRDPAGEKDPDQLFLRYLRFLPGTPKQDLWRNLLLTLCSWRFHAAFMRARWNANVRSASLPRRLAAVAFLSGVLGLVALTGAWVPVLLAWLFPLTALYHASALLQFASEHLWFSVQAAGQSRRRHLGQLTVGRFCGDPAPSSTRVGLERWLAWTRWWARLFLVHVPTRLAVLVGDLPDHDLHHRLPKHDWANSRAERLAYLRGGLGGWPAPLVEAWSLTAALDTVFEHISQLPAEVPSAAPPAPSMLGM